MKKTIINFRELKTHNIVAHDGKGTIAWARIVDNKTDSNINFIDRAIIPPSSSIGKHSHTSSEEIYFILSGNGEMLLGKSTFSVKPFDIIINKCDSHGLVNNSKKDIEIFVIEVNSVEDI